MKRKLLSLLLALTLCVGMAVPAFAVEETPANPDPTTDATTDPTDPADPADPTAPADPADPADPAAPAWTLDDAAAKAAADKLNGLGLFQGVGDNADGTPNYELNRAPNRMEAITMLVRLLGKEAAATAGTWETPFTDVDAWALPYVGYAYTNGLTLGTGDTTFGGADTITASQYLTFVLRALGYDSSSDFTWDAAWELSDKLGITAGEYKDIPATDFLRGHVAIVSVAALDVTLKDSAKTLLTVIQENLAADAAGDTDAGAGDAAGEDAAAGEDTAADADDTKTDDTKTDDTADKAE